MQGHVVGHVYDLGQDVEIDTRLSQTSEDKRYHCDPADIVSLMCLNPAIAGMTRLFYERTNKIHPKVYAFGQQKAVKTQIIGNFHVDAAKWKQV